MSNAETIRKALKLMRALMTLRKDGFTHIQVQSPIGDIETIELPMVEFNDKIESLGNHIDGRYV